MFKSGNTHGTLIAVLHALVFTLTCGCNRAVSTPFMPLDIGNTWRYRFTVLPDNTESTFTMGITKRESKGFRMPEPGGGPSWWRIEAGFLVLERPGELLRFFEVPPREGVSWWQKGADGRRYCIKVVRREYIGTPAGDFLGALRVEMESENRGKQAVFHFAKDVGLVKRVSFEGEKMLTLELLDFTRSSAAP